MTRWKHNLTIKVSEVLEYSIFGVTEERRDFSEMRRTSVCWLLLLCFHFYFLNAGSSSHHVQRRESGPKRNFSAVIGTKMVVSPTWYLSVGDTVEINCTAHNDKGNYSDKLDLQLIWTKMGPGDRTKKVLVSQRASEGIHYVLGPVTHEHQGVYTCDDDGSIPDVYVHDWHHVIWVADASQRASIDVISHNRSQFAHGESFTLSCQLPDDDTQWKMMRFDAWFGNITECPDQVSSGRRLSCTSTSKWPWWDRLYWCESSTGERSNAINITTTISVKVILESPPLPVLEGDDVTLRCLHRADRKIKEFTTSARADFWRNDYKMIRICNRGITTLKAVTKADEGFYKCSHPQDGFSHDSWISVKARPAGDQEKSDINTS